MKSILTAQIAWMVLLSNSGLASDSPRTTQLQAQQESEDCAPKAQDYAMKYGPILDSERIALGFTEKSGTSIFRYSYWFPLQGKRTGCYVLYIDPGACRVISAYTRKSTWYAGCPVFEPSASPLVPEPDPH